MFRKTALFTTVLALGAPLLGSQINVLWNGGTGDWTDPAQWTPSVVPDNSSGSDTYLVTINSGMQDTVNLPNRTVFLDGLTTGPQASVNVDDQGIALGNALSSTAMLTNAGTMTFMNAASLSLDYSGGASATNSGVINIGDESAIYMTAPTGGSGTLNNTGSINLTSNPHGSQIYLSGDGATFTFSGAGTLTLSDNAANLITGSFGTESLVNGNTLSGAGTITNLTNFINTGTVTANGVNPLIFNMDYSIGTTNLTGAITNNGTINVANGGTLTLQGGNSDFSLANFGTISLNGQDKFTQLIYNDNNNHHSLFLSQGGTLSLSDSAGNLIEGANGDEKLFNQLNHTITGAGTITGFGGGIVNNGTIIANGSNPLNIGVTDAVLHGNPGITNNGLIQVNDGSTLQIISGSGATILNSGSITLNANTSTSTLTFNDFGAAGKTPGGNFLEVTGGMLTLSDNPGNRITGGSGDEGLQIDYGAKLSGAGTITNLGGYEGVTNLGTIVASGHNPLILDGTANTAVGFSALSNFGVLQINDGSTFEIRSTIGTSTHNWSGFAPGGGSITLNASASTSTLGFDSMGLLATFTLDGGPGTITMTDNPGNRIVGISGAESLVFDTTQTISGAGTIGNFVSLVNDGKIIANGANPLVLAVGQLSAGGLTNTGTIQVNDGSTLEILHSGANVRNTGQITLNAALGTSTLAVNDQGVNMAYVKGGGFAGGGSFSALELFGPGTLTMSDNAGNRIVGVNGDEALLNASVIQGAGTIGNFGAGVGNSGTIIANGVHPLIIDITTATNYGLVGLGNSGLIQINDGSTLQILSSSGGTVLNNGAGQITLNSAAGTSTLSFNDLGKGQTFTLDATPGASAFSVAMSNGPGNRITGVNGDETLINAANSSIIGRGVISNFAQFINNGGLQTGGAVLEVAAPLENWNGATQTLTGGTYVADGGKLLLDSLGSQTITNLNGAHAHVEGAGIISGNGSVNALSGLANMTNSIVDIAGPSGALTITPNGSSTLTLKNSTFNVFAGAAVTVNGAFSQDVNSALIVGGSGTGAASVAAADFINSGSLFLNSNATATFTGVASNTGTVEVAAGSQLSVLKSAFRTVGSNVYTQTAGLTKVLTGGVLSAAAFNLEGGILGGGGTIAANVNVTGGTVVPGDPTIMDIDGDFTLDTGGEILLEIDGPGAGQFDGLDIAGNLHLDGGTLDVRFGDGYLPQPGDSWNILSFTGTEDGSGFDNLVFENAGNEQFLAFILGQNFALQTQQPQEAPEPATLLLVSVALIGGLWRYTHVFRAR